MVTLKKNHWLDQKHSPFLSPTYSDNTKWDTVDACTSVDEEAIGKAKGRINTPLEYLGCTNPPKYHDYRFHNYSNCHKKIDMDVV